MVIQDLGLWNSLNKGFAGSRSVTLTEAATWEQALVLAAVERPDVVVCSGRGLGISPGQLAGEFKARQISGIHIVCAVEDEYGAAAPAPDSGLVLCESDRLLEILKEHLARIGDRPLGPRVQLLANFEDIRGVESARAGGFANVLEVSCRELLLEADQPLVVGDVFGLNFFVPRTAVTDCTNISLVCRVSQSRNEEKLLYVAEIVDLNTAASETLGCFVSYQERVQGAES